MWASLSSTTKFSLIAFGVSLGLSVLSMGALGYGLYYLVKPILGNRIEEIHGDATWPTVILAGILWSFGFLIASLVVYYLQKFQLSGIVKNLIYISTLWIWLLLIWWWLIEFKVVK